MKKILLFVFVALAYNSCGTDDHFHDGRYHADIDVFGVSFAKVDYEINGSQITIDNSISGVSKLNCKQYEHRIEYVEQNGTTKVLPVLENGDIQFNDQIILKKIAE